MKNMFILKWMTFIGLASMIVLANGCATRARQETLSKTWDDDTGHHTLKTENSYDVTSDPVHMVHHVFSGLFGFGDDYYPVQSGYQYQTVQPQQQPVIINNYIPAAPAPAQQRPPAPRVQQVVPVQTPAPTSFVQPEIPVESGDDSSCDSYDNGYTTPVAPVTVVRYAPAYAPPQQVVYVEPTQTYVQPACAPYPYYQNDQYYYANAGIGLSFRIGGSYGNSSYRVVQQPRNNFYHSAPSYYRPGPVARSWSGGYGNGNYGSSAHAFAQAGSAHAYANSGGGQHGGNFYSGGGSHGGGSHGRH